MIKEIQAGIDYRMKAGSTIYYLRFLSINDGKDLHYNIKKDGEFFKGGMCRLGVSIFDDFNFTPKKILPNGISEFEN